MSRKITKALGKLAEKIAYKGSKTPKTVAEAINAITERTNNVFERIDYSNITFTKTSTGQVLTEADGTPYDFTRIYLNLFVGDTTADTMLVSFKKKTRTGETDETWCSFGLISGIAPDESVPNGVDMYLEVKNGVVELKYNVKKMTGAEAASMKTFCFAPPINQNDAPVALTGFSISFIDATELVNTRINSMFAVRR